ncbi:hypothetical protein NQZ68_003753 [Dissostichus eleginoides]|nr:hypothetical protein NQZ68_003753 [Dissostichus eleginoides]
MCSGRAVYRNLFCLAEGLKHPQDCCCQLFCHRGSLFDLHHESHENTVLSASSARCEALLKNEQLDSNRGHPDDNSM